jgi:DNA-binding GntR family transcriptional regulator
VSVPSPERISFGEAAYRRIRTDIVSCRMAPGERFTERALAEATGFGISPIRDALTRLDHEGLVRTLPRKGYQVTPLTLKSVDDLFTLWRIVGPELARLGVRDADPDQRIRAIAAFKAVSELRQNPPLDSEDLTVQVADKIDEAFAILAEATDNQYLIVIFERLQNEVARIWSIASQADVVLPSQQFDSAWVQFLEQRDGDGAAAHVAAFVSEAHTRLLRILSRWPSIITSEITSLNS